MPSTRQRFMSMKFDSIDIWRGSQGRFPKAEDEDKRSFVDVSIRNRWGAVRDIPATTASVSRPSASIHWRSCPSRVRACPGTDGRDDGTGGAAECHHRPAQAVTASPSARPHALAAGRSKWSFCCLQPLRYRTNRKPLFVRQSQYRSNVLHVSKSHLLPSHHSSAPRSNRGPEWQNGACESRSLCRKTVRDLMESLSANYRNPHSRCFLRSDPKTISIWGN